MLIKNLLCSRKILVKIVGIETFEMVFVIKHISHAPPPNIAFLQKKKKVSSP